MYTCYVDSDYYRQFVIAEYTVKLSDIFEKEKLRLRSIVKTNNNHNGARTSTLLVIDNHYNRCYPLTFS